MQLTFADARNLGPRRVAQYMRENLSKPEQLSELKGMLAAGGKLTNLAHGVAVELKLAEDEELKAPLVESLKMAPKDLVVGYGGQVDRDVAKPSPFAGKGPMYARMGQSTDPES